MFSHLFSEKYQTSLKYNLCLQRAVELFQFTMHCIFYRALNNTLLYNVLHFTVMYCARNCTVECSTLNSCTALFNVLLHCTAVLCYRMYYTLQLYCTVKCTALYTLLYCRTYCTVEFTALYNVMQCRMQCSVVHWPACGPIGGAGLMSWSMAGDLYTVHCTLYTVHCTLYTVHCTLCTVHCMLQCSLHSVSCSGRTVFSMARDGICRIMGTQLRQPEHQAAARYSTSNTVLSTTILSTLHLTLYSLPLYSLLYI